MQNSAVITHCQRAGVLARLEVRPVSAPYDGPDMTGHSFMLRPYGWLYPMVHWWERTRLGRRERRLHSDLAIWIAFRMPANLAFQHEFIPPKQFMRNDPTDNQYGECEYNDRCADARGTEARAYHGGYSSDPAEERTGVFTPFLELTLEKGGQRAELAQGRGRIVSLPGILTLLRAL